MFAHASYSNIRFFHLSNVDKKERSQTRDEGTFRQGEDEEDPKSPLEIPKGCLQIFSWSLTLPALLLFYVTIPDCRKKAWARWYPVTFLVALAWIAGLTYVLVWMVTIVGEFILLRNWGNEKDIS